MAAVIVFTTGAPGVGKTYIRCARFLVDDFLLNSDGLHISNFPLYRDVIVNDVVRRMNFGKTGILAKISAPFRRKHRIIPADEVARRIVVIPDEILQMWKREESGPWDFFAHVDLKGSHIAIDEIHNYISVESSDAHVKKWDEFLGEVRHRGCTFEALTQQERRVHDCVRGRAAIRLELVAAEDMRDPYFKIMLSDWYELKAAFTGDFHKTVFEREFQLRFSRWKELRTRRFMILPEYFKFYNSYNASLSEKELGVDDSNRAPEYEYQKRTRISLLWWFFSKNFVEILTRFALLSLLLWLFAFGGFGYLGGQFFKFNREFFAAQRAKAADVTGKGKGKLAPPKPGKPGVLPASAPFSASSVLDSGRAGEGVQQVAIDPKELDALRADLAASQAKEKQLQEEIKRLKEERLKGFKPVFFGGDEVVLANGMRIRVGYKFNNKDGAEYEGKSVVSIRPRDRCYELDDGLVVRM